MAKVVDIGSKRLISLAPNNWVQWVTQRSDILVKEFLSSEFQLIERKSDFCQFCARNSFSQRNHEVGYDSVERITLV